MKVVTLDEDHWARPTSKTHSGNNGFVGKTHSGKNAFVGKTHSGNNGFVGKTHSGKNGFVGKTHSGNNGFVGKTHSGNNGFVGTQRGRQREPWFCRHAARTCRKWSLAFSLSAATCVNAWDT